MARTWAARCEFTHGHPEEMNPSGGVGQNIYMGYAVELTRAIMSWYNETNDYNYNTLQCRAADKMCGHYTQV